MTIWPSSAVCGWSIATGRLPGSASKHTVGASAPCGSVASLYLWAVSGGAIPGADAIPLPPEPNDKKGTLPMICTQRYASPLGGILLAADEQGLTGLWFDHQKYFAGYAAQGRGRAGHARPCRDRSLAGHLFQRPRAGLSAAAAPRRAPLSVKLCGHCCCKFPTARPLPTAN